MSQPAQVTELDVSCAKCTYSLRGLERGGRCPECGHDIEASWRRREEASRDPYRLAAATVPWRRWVRLGLWTIFVSGVLLHLATSTSHLRFVLSAAPFRRPVFREILMALMASAMVALIVGVLLIAARRPVPHRRYRVLRSVCIGSAIAFLLVVGALFSSLLIGWKLLPLNTRSMMWMLAIASGCVSFSAWWYLSVFLGDMGANVQRWARGLAVFSAFAAIAPPCAGSLLVRPGMSSSTVGMPCIGAVDALLIAVNSMRFQPWTDWRVGVYLVAGLTGLASLAVLFVVAKSMRRLPP